MSRTDDPLAPGAEYDEDDDVGAELIERAPTGRDLAVIHAAEAALQDPTIAGRDEFLALAMHARMLSMSSVVPKALQGKPHDVMVVLLTGRDLGIPLTAALRKVYVVDGSPVVAPQLIAALVRRKGLGSIKPHEANSAEWAAAVPYGPDGRQLGPASVFTWADAQTAGLVDPSCNPDAHNLRTLTKPARGGGTYTRTNACECKDNWRHYPARMLYARALGYAAADFFPDATLGLYQADELGSVTDEDGRPIDAESVELPEGFESEEEKKAAARAAAEAAVTPEERAEEEQTRWAVQERLAALPEEARIDFRQRWKAHSKLQEHTIRNLPANLFGLVTAMLSGFENSAKATGWSPVIERTHVQQAIAARIAWVYALGGAVALDPPPPPLDPAPDPDPPQNGQEPADPAASELVALADAIADVPDDVAADIAVDAADALAAPSVAEDAARQEAALQAIIDAVKAMDRETRLAMLGERDLKTTGNMDTLGQRLAMALVAEHWIPPT